MEQKKILRWEIDEQCRSIVEQESKISAPFQVSHTRLPNELKIGGKLQHIILAGKQNVDYQLRMRADTAASEPLFGFLYSG